MQHEKSATQNEFKKKRVEKVPEEKIESERYSKK